MRTPSAILTSPRRLLVVAAGLFLLVGLCACHRGAKPNANANSGGPTSGTTDPEQAKREAQTLVDQGKELYKNDEDERAAQVFQQAIKQDPNNAEAHLRLGMAFGALERKPEADEAYKKAVELYKKKVQSEPKDAEAFFNLGEAHSFLHQDEDAAREPS